MGFYKYHENLQVLSYASFRHFGHHAHLPTRWDQRLDLQFALGCLRRTAKCRPADATCKCLLEGLIHLNSFDIKNHTTVYPKEKRNSEPNHPTLNHHVPMKFVFFVRVYGIYCSLCIIDLFSYTSTATFRPTLERTSELNSCTKPFRRAWQTAAFQQLFGFSDLFLSSSLLRFDSEYGDV